MSKARNLAVVVALLAGTIGAPPVAAKSGMSFSNEYGELADLGRIFLNLYVDSYTDNPYRLACGPHNFTVNRDGGSIHVIVAVEPGRWPNGPPDCDSFVSLGELPAGAYSVTADLTPANGPPVESLVADLRVARAGGKCNARPDLPDLIVLHQTYSATEFLQHAETDTAFGELLGHPLNVRSLLYSFVDMFPPYMVLRYRPPENLIVISDRLMKSGQFKSAGPNFSLCYFGAGDRVEPVVEFLNSASGHYFYTAELPEIRSIERGDAGPGWSRTGKSFTAVTEPGCPSGIPDTWGPIYRFSGVPGKGPNSHFYTANREECYAVDQDPGWRYESSPFWAWTPDGGTCPAGMTPLYRAYNGRWRENDSNHRYSTERSVIDQMVSAGWRDEGAVMCVVR